MKKRILARVADYIDVPWYSKQVGKRFFTSSAAAIHYIGEGELRGNWPNPIFDPHFYRRQMQLPLAQSSLEHFVNSRTTGVLPCKFFDIDWYELRNPDYAHLGCGLLHYLSVGCKQYRDPSPQVDMIALSRNHGGIGNGAILVNAISTGLIDSLSTNAVTNNDAQLVQRQREFRKKITSLLITRTEKPLHGHNLLFVQCAKDTNFWSWFDKNRPRDWDVFLNCYADNFPETESAEHICIQNGTKFTGILNCWLNHAAVFEMYEYIMFIDDDLEFRFDDISIFFKEMQRADLDLAQPSLSHDSCCSWPVFFNTSSVGTRNTNGVEIMMPALSKRARDLLLPYFVFSVSGFGLDILMGKIAEEKGRLSGVVDTVIAKHRRKIDTSGGSYYEYLRKHSINPQYELNRIIKLFKTSTSLVCIEKQTRCAGTNGATPVAKNSDTEGWRMKNVPKYIFDIGMHRGIDTMFYLKKVFKVVGIEASPTLTQECAVKFSKSISKQDLFIENFGIHNSDTTLDFYLNLDCDEWSSFQSNLGTRENTRFSIVKVPCKPLAYFIEKYGMPYYMKIDVEGVDALVVRELQSFKDRPSYLSAEDGGIDTLIALYESGARSFKFINQLAIRNFSIPTPALEGNDVPHKFEESSSGPFGLDLPGEWLTVEDAFYFYLTKVRPPSSMPINGWWDIHVRYE